MNSKERKNKTGLNFIAQNLTALMPAIRPKIENKAGRMQHQGKERKIAIKLFALLLLIEVSLRVLLNLSE
jgi:hypothetical protein